MATFGENLRRLRARAGFRTAKGLADVVGIVPSVVSRLEHDQQGLPEGPTLLKLAKALRCSIDDLLDGLDRDYDTVRHRRVPTAAPHEADPLDSAATPPIATHAAEEGNSDQTDLVYKVKRGRANRIKEGTANPYNVDGPLYAIVLRSDTMEPLLKNGMQLMVSSTYPVGDGDLAYVQLKSGERLVKIATAHRGGWLLASANPACPPRFVHKNQVVLLHRVAYAKLSR